jgi:thiosulfate/3-mercaptopyruvate sulfurtransferase
MQGKAYTRQGMKAKLSLIVEPDELEPVLHDPAYTIVDLSKQDNYKKYHIPGALELDYNKVVLEKKPVGGLVPDETSVSALFESLGITAETHVIAYDDEGGGKAGRFLWTLEIHGHQNISLLNGGIFAWANEGFPLTDAIPKLPEPTHYPVTLSNTHVADESYILNHLKDTNLVLLDTRSPEEFCGIKKYADRGGHIPGAINFNWTNAMDQNNNLRLLPRDTLESMLLELGVSKENEVIAYCHTHHRSSHTYYVLKYLGYENIKGYPGAWSEWGNDPAVPVEACSDT